MWRRLFHWLITALLALPAWAQVDINTATQSELESLPGIGPSKARAILEYRQQHGPFQSVDELVKVKGIGPATVERLRPDIVARPVRRGRIDADRAQTRR